VESISEDSNFLCIKLIEEEYVEEEPSYSQTLHTSYSHSHSKTSHRDGRYHKGTDSRRDHSETGTVSIENARVKERDIINKETVIPAFDVYVYLILNDSN